MNNNLLNTFLLIILFAAIPISAKTLKVGPGKKYQRIEDANAKARAGDTILVYPQKDNKPYEKVAVFVREKKLTFKAVPTKENKRVVLSGKGFDFSGVGSTPRAIFQFNKGSDDCTVEGFELIEAHNNSHNGAGVRINQANNVTIRNCEIRNNDMGIMSNSDGTRKTGVNQIIENCLIHHNGSFKEPGYNHNLYLGGTSVTLRFCEIYNSLTGHNIKSRAHFTNVLYCYIHDSANRELDLVDGKDTEAANSHAVLMGNIIVKAKNCKGNKGTIHFGQDGRKEHDGTLYLIHNTILTPYISPVIFLSAGKGKAHLIGNFISDGGTKQSGQVIVNAKGKATSENVTGSNNWFGRGFSLQPETKLSKKANYFGKHVSNPFYNPEKHDYRPKKPLKKGLAIKEIKYPLPPGYSDKKERPLSWQYLHPAGKKPRKIKSKPTLGACEK